MFLLATSENKSERPFDVDLVGRLTCLRSGNLFQLVQESHGYIAVMTFEVLWVSLVERMESTERAQVCQQVVP